MRYARIAAWRPGLPLSRKSCRSCCRGWHRRTSRAPGLASAVVAAPLVPCLRVRPRLAAAALAGEALELVALAAVALAAVHLCRPLPVAAEGRIHPARPAAAIPWWGRPTPAWKQHRRRDTD